MAPVGDGGDESFAGYERYAAMAWRARAGAQPPRSRLLHALPRAGERRSTLHRAARFLDAQAVRAASVMA